MSGFKELGMSNIDTELDRLVRETILPSEKQDIEEEVTPAAIKLASIKIDMERELEKVFTSDKQVTIALSNLKRIIDSNKGAVGVDKYKKMVDNLDKLYKDLRYNHLVM